MRSEDKIAATFLLLLSVCFVGLLIKIKDSQIHKEEETKALCQEHGEALSPIEMDYCLGIRGPHDARGFLIERLGRL